MDDTARPLEVLRALVVTDAETWDAVLRARAEHGPASALHADAVEEHDDWHDLMLTCADGLALEHDPQARAWLAERRAAEAGDPYRPGETVHHPLPEELQREAEHDDPR